MPILTSQNMNTTAIDGTGYGFSATRIEDLGASEYTLATVVVDVSSSVNSFRQGIEECVQEVVKACGRSPRADNLMLRVLLFNTHLQEFHGFRPLAQCNVDDYKGAIQPNGGTALFDAAYNGIEGSVKYGKTLVDNDFDVNGIVIVITDGDDNSSSMTAKSVGDALDNVRIQESLESVVSILVGINRSGGSGLSNYLQTFKDQAGFSQYIELDKADERALAKLADFVSRSISSQSQALGTGGPSQSLTI